MSIASTYLPAIDVAMFLAGARLRPSARAQAGGGALAGSFTSGQTTTTWVPLIDASGSTIALVNAASTQSPPATTFTYGPFGSLSTSGASTTWPFQYQGLEHEFTDPWIPLYYTGGGQYYDAQIMRSLSEASQTSSNGTGGGSSGGAGGASGGGGFSPSGNAIAAPSGGGQESYWSLVKQQNEDLLESLFEPGPDIDFGGSEGFPVPVRTIIQFFENMADFVEWLFGGGGSPEIPRQLLHKQHPLYPVILGVSDGLIPTEGSEGLKVCGDPCPCTDQPLQKKSPAPSPTPTPAPPPSCGEALGELAVGAVGTALTLGPIVAAPYLAPELFEGFEGVASFGKMGIVAVPGLTLMEQGFVGVRQSCF